MNRCQIVAGGLCIAGLLLSLGCSGDSDNPGDLTPKIDAESRVEPHTAVVLDASATNAASYAWAIDRRPDGSHAALSDATAPDPVLLADIAGEYVVCLTVGDANGASARECITIEAIPTTALHVELVWSSASGGEADLDLHYVAPGGDWFQLDGDSRCVENGSVVWWCAPTPDWGPGGVADGERTNNPRLDVDNIYGNGPENINQDELFDGPGFRIGVHHYCDFGNGPADARVRVFIDGELRFEETRTLAMRDFWEVASLTVNGGGERVEIDSLDVAFDSGVGECP